MFSCIMRHIAATRTLLAAITAMDITAGDQPIIDNQARQHPATQLLCERYRAQLEQKMAFYRLQLQHNIIPKITQHYSRRPESQPLLSQLPSLLDLVRQEEHHSAAA